MKNYKTKNKTHAYSSLNIYIKKHTLAIIISILALCVLVLTDGIIYKFLIPQLIDEGLISKNQTFITNAPLYILNLFLIRGLSSAALTYIVGYIGKNITNTIKCNILLHLYNLPNSYFHNNSTGNIISKINYDTEQLALTLTDSLPEFIKGVLIFTILSCVMLSINTYICITILILIPLFIYTLQKIGNLIKKYSLSTQSSIGDITAASKEIINLQQLIKIYNVTDTEKNKITFLIKNNKKNEQKILFFQAFSIPIIQLLGALALSATIYLYNTDIIKISIGEFTAILTAMIGLLKPIKQIAQINTSIQKGLAALNSIFSILHAPKETNTKKEIITHANSNLKFNNVSFKHKPHDKSTLTNIKLNINLTDAVGVIGSSGSGKTTLANLLQRFDTPTYGNIMINKTNLEDIALKNLRRNIAVSHQNTMLFNDSIEYNITYGNKNLSKKKLKNALIQADCMSFVKKLKNNIHEQIGDNGSLLSGGQQQKLIIARLIFKNAPIIILDEATSSLDLVSEKIIEKYINKNINKKFILIITHKFNILRLVKKIIILNNGNIKKILSYKDLVKNEKYKNYTQ